MYNKHFGFNESPFSIAPDPRYLYMSEQHREALAHLMYGYNSDGGFVLITGEVGTGKTTVCRCMIEQIPENSAIAFILNPKLTVEELLATICDEFRIKYPENTASIKVFTDLINAYLLDAHSRDRKAVLIIDEAQNLSAEVLEQLRLLTNLETSRHKLLQIILLGQPELRDKLSKPELRQLSQRIIARYHLGALSQKDVGAYVAHRLSVAGMLNKVFRESAIRKLCRLSKGVPRLINLLCDRALLGAYTLGRNEVDKSILTQAAREVFGKAKTRRRRQHRNAAAWMLSAFILAVVGVVLAASYYKEGVKKVTHEPIKPVIADSTQMDSIQMQSIHWPDNQPIDRSSEMAFQELFKLWDIPFQPGDERFICDQAAANGLQCYKSVGSANNVLNLNSPAVLKLFDDQRREFHALLKSFEKDSGTLILGSETITVSLKEIESHWPGEFLLFWRPPSVYKNIIRPGETDNAVPWINKHLALINGKEIREGENMLFDDNLVKEVKEFQVVRGLKPDGIVGTQTLIHINASVDGNSPKLMIKREDK